jgi:hypothetical protein
MTDDAGRRALIQRMWDHIGTDHEISHEIYADDAVLEFPQSGERFERLATTGDPRSRRSTSSSSAATR